MFIIVGFIMNASTVTDNNVHYMKLLEIIIYGGIRDLHPTSIRGWFKAIKYIVFQTSR